MVHEQRFKDLFSSTCQVSVERIVLNLESEVMRNPGSIPIGGNILSLDFFSCSKDQFRLIREKREWCKSVTIVNNFKNVIAAIIY